MGKDDKKHKRKKEKKHKKDKKRHKHRDREDNGDSSDSDWVEAAPQLEPQQQSHQSVKRDDWMSLPTAGAAAAADDDDENGGAADPFAAFGVDIQNERKTARLSAKQAEEDEKERKRKALELNPFFKDGGTGMPPEQSKESSGANTSSSLSRSQGARRSWRDKVLERRGSSRSSRPESASGTPSQAPSFATPSSRTASRPSSTARMMRPASHASGWVSSQGSSAAATPSRQGDGQQSGQRPSAATNDELRGADKRSSDAAAQLTTLSSEAPPGHEMEMDEDEPVPTETELNDIGAAILRAELMGDEDEVKELQQKKQRMQARMDAAKARGSSSTAAPRKRKEEEVLLLSKTRGGMVTPAKGEDLSNVHKRHKFRKVQTHDGSGERERYFADDDQLRSVTQMAQEERTSTSADFDLEFARMVGRDSRRVDDDDFTLDDKLVERAAGLSKKIAASRDRQQAITDFQRQQKVMANCMYCLDTKRFRTELLVSLGAKVYLAVPERGALNDRHVILVPQRHVTSTRELDEDEWDEMEMYKRCLVDMFKSLDMDIIFFECSMKLRQQRHAVVHGVPLSRDDGAMAPMFFKKAILESDAEWAQNKRLIDTTEKGLRRSVPQGFPYFHVSFGTDGGFAHVIESEELFPHYFGQEIVGGMLDMEPRTWLHPPADELAARRANKVSRSWKPFDWTEMMQAPS